MLFGKLETYSVWEIKDLWIISQVERLRLDFTIVYKSAITFVNAGLILTRIKFGTVNSSKSVLLLLTGI